MASTPHVDFELLVIDPSGASTITSVESLMHGFLFAEKLWRKAEVLNHEGQPYIRDAELGLVLVAQPIDTSSAINDDIQSAFLIRVSSKQQELLEQFRPNCLAHLKNRLGFSNIRILQDDASAFLARQIYPLIYQVENRLRRYLVKFFIQKVGINWFEKSVRRRLTDKVQYRRETDKIFAAHADQDVMLLDFDDLGELVYRPQQSAQRTEQLLRQLLSAETPEDVQRIKAEWEGNYGSYLKRAFQDQDFERKWRTLAEIRNRVAHNSLFTKADLDAAVQLCNDLSRIILQAEEKINEFHFSKQEERSIVQAAMEADLEQDAVEPAPVRRERLPRYEFRASYRNEQPERRTRFSEPVVDYDERQPGMEDEEYRVITESELLDQLEKAERWHSERGMDYVGLKGFVTKWLANNHFAISPAYAIVNMLKEQGTVVVYDVNLEGYDYPVKAIRRALENEVLA